jgi:hypothetical protein
MWEQPPRLSGGDVTLAGVIVAGVGTVASRPGRTGPPAAVPPHNFKKPPATVASAPQERKIKAHAASRG